MAQQNERTPLLRNGGPQGDQRGRINSDSVPELYSSYNYNNRGRAIKACVIILIVEALERLAHYSVNANLILFLTDDPHSWTYFDAMQLMFLYMGFSYMMSVFGGWLGDSVLGRFNILVASFFFYWGGFAFLLILSIQSKCVLEAYPFLRNFSIPLPYCNVSVAGDIAMHGSAPPSMMPILPLETPCALWVYLALLLIAIGSGMFKANIAPFGADQVLCLGDSATRTFFSWFYWSTNIGSLLALGPIAFLQQNFDFFIGYAIPFVIIIFATVLFIVCYPLYSVNPPGITILSNVIRIVFYAIRTTFKRIFCRSRSPPRNKGLIDPDHCRPEAWIDVSKVRYGGPFHDEIVNNVKTFFSVLFFFVSLVPYWMTYFQMETSFVMQALHMRLDLPRFSADPKPANITPAADISLLASNAADFAFDGIYAKNESAIYATPSTTLIPTKPYPSPTSNSTSTSYQFPVAALSLFDVVFLIFFIPLMDWIQRAFDRRGKVIPILLRFYLGIFFALLAVLWAGVLETERLTVFWEGCHAGLPPWNFSIDEYNASCANSINQTIHKNTTYNAADMSVAFQVPQYCLIGISEAFASVAGLEFAYNGAPKCMQGLIMGFFWLFTGIGSLLGSGLAAALRGVWFHSPSYGLNYDRMDYYYYLLAGILFSSFFFLPWTIVRGYTVDERRKLLRRNSTAQPVIPKAENTQRRRRSRNRMQRNRPPRQDDANYLGVGNNSSSRSNDPDNV